ncbi:hypothetical protein MNBD_BACTEROID03-2210 [hydrothermal vent metagenome]|uniref:Copper resistance protein NlpE n=1 Tax=hydrothermal vent metagenome TaxID=652676 RepID=A0A3B0UC93_9ZZZZ
MKETFAILILISNLTLFSQSDKIVGNYSLTLGNKENHLVEYKLTLNQDGSFFFHSYSDNKRGIPPEVNKYGKGKWIAENKVITFLLDKEKDFDDKHTLDFNNSKARFVIKSPRDKADRIIKTRLKFFESEIFWIKGIDMFKI